MRITITFNREKELLLPVSHNYLLQGLVYNFIDEKLADFLHKQGFQVNKRNFKLFTFSRIQGRLKYLKKEKKFKLSPPFKLVISSPIENFVQSLAENLVRAPEVQLNGSKVFVESIEAHFMPDIKPPVKIRMLSPLTVYSTLYKANGDKKTYYYKPFEREFCQLIRENLFKKYKAFYERETNGASFSIEPLRVGNRDQKIVDYKGTQITGWTGSYELNGSPELIALAYETGLGSKNSQGFGCFEVLGKQ